MWNLHHLQERATKISHGNTARHAKELGDPMLATLCGAVASDEGRHEIAYQRIVQKFFELCVFCCNLWMRCITSMHLHASACRL